MSGTRVTDNRDKGLEAPHMQVTCQGHVTANPSGPIPKAPGSGSHVGREIDRSPRVSNTRIPLAVSLQRRFLHHLEAKPRVASPTKGEIVTRLMQMGIPQSSTASPPMYDGNIPPNAQRCSDGPNERNSSSKNESDDPMSPLIIDEGASHDPDVNEDSMQTDFENKLYKKFLLLVEVAPGIIHILQRAGEQASPELSLELDRVKCWQGSVDVMQAGSRGSHKQACCGDINGICGVIGLWPCIDWQPAFPIACHLLGFNHHTSGRLLCPVTLNWANDSIYDALHHSMQNVTVADHPAFLWSQDVFTLNNIYKWFLHGPAYKYIFISPSSTKETDRSTHGGNASLHDLTFVTYESVAYVTMVTHFALSNKLAFGPGGHDNNIQVEILEHKELMPEDELVSLLQWWNEKIFPHTLYSSDNVRNNSVGAIMCEQARARWLADEAAAAMVIAGEEGSEIATVPSSLGSD
ncbi:hypothetical protein EDB86DRAFT_2837331 [Lactarius hatsudake]|nr:hypothetical protein EDB86DRAFT_2837331 [Lactarius hatsudake]